MSKIYIKQRSVVTAEAFDPRRDDQGAQVTRSAQGEFLGATVFSRGRLVSVRPGDMIVTDDLGVYPCSHASFAGLFQPLADVLLPGAAGPASPASEPAAWEGVA